MTSEGQYLATLAHIFSTSDPRVEVGIGDDAAVVSAITASLALATDMAVEGVHFTREWSNLFDIGGKVAAANLADIVAMGGVARYLLVAAAIPAEMTLDEVSELARGIQSEASKVGAHVVGGDLTRSPLLTIAISVFGEVNKPFLRSGAQPGDVVAVSALPGASARGLEDIKKGLATADAQLHRYPSVDYEKIKNLDPDVVHALTDVSDGLVSELEGIAKASDVAIALTSSTTTRNPDVLHGGEDHVFVGTFSSCPQDWIEIGQVRSGSGVTLDGENIEHQGFTHF